LFNHSVDQDDKQKASIEKAQKIIRKYIEGFEESKAEESFRDVNLSSRKSSRVSIILDKVQKVTAQ